jgi:hypothetical protein
MVFFSNDMGNIKGSKDHRQQPEKRQRHLTPDTSKFPAICHPLILNEMHTKPLHGRYHQMLFAKEVISFYVNLQRLIQEQNDQGEEERMP